MKIGTKLLGGFLTVALLCAITGTVALVRMDNMRDNADHMGRTLLPSAVALGKINAGVLDSRRSALGLLVARQQGDEAESLDRSADVDSAIARTQAAAATYHALPHAAGEDSLWKALVPRLEAYHADLGRQQAWLNSNEVSRALAAVGESKEAMRELQGTVQQLRAVQESLAVAGARKADANASTSQALLMSVVLASILMAIGLGVTITRGITRPIGEVVKHVNRLRDVGIAKMGEGAEALARGNFEFQIVADTALLQNDAADETGDLARAVNGIIEQTHASGLAFERARVTLNSAISDAEALARAAHEGRLDARADHARYEGGYRELVTGMNRTLEAVDTAFKALGQVLDRAAQRDLSARVAGQFQGAYGAMQQMANTTIENLDEALGEVALASEEVAAASDQISSGGQSLAEGASEQASALEEVSASLQELASMAKQSADNAREARGLSDAARSDTAQGMSNLQQLTEAIQNIKGSSDKTAKIVKTIDEIAFQTNLLALNAAVEAARAGDAGKGFAVVAEEVRNLALRSAEAAKSTASLIEESVQHAGTGVSVTEDVVRSLDQITDRVTKVAEVMAEIAAASEQQTQGIGQISTAVEQMNASTQAVASNSEESASASLELSTQAQRMQEMVGRFSLTTVHAQRQAQGSGPRPVRALDGHVRARAASRPAPHAPTRRTPARSSAVAAEAVIPFSDGADRELLAEF